VDGKPLKKGLVTNDVFKLLKGPTGTLVEVDIERPDETSTLHFSIERAKIPIESVPYAYMIRPGVGYVRIIRFAQTTGEELDKAIGSLRDVCGRTSDLRAVPRGPARSAILATAITVLGHPAVCEVLPAGEAARLGAGAAGLLADHPDAFVLAGWPAVLLGSKHRYIGLAWLAAQQPERAERHLVQAVDENRDFGVLQTRSQFDLARARMRLPGRYQRGRTELGRARERAAALGMQGLVRQADSERERQPPPAG